MLQIVSVTEESVIVPLVECVPVPVCVLLVMLCEVKLPCVTPLADKKREQIYLECCWTYLSDSLGVARQARCIWTWQVHVNGARCVTCFRSVKGALATRTAKAISMPDSLEADR